MHHFCWSPWSSDWAPPFFFLVVEAICVSTVHIWVYWIFANASVLLRILLMDTAANSLFSQLVWRQMNICWSWDYNLCSAGFTESETAVLFPLPFPGAETVLVLSPCTFRFGFMFTQGLVSFPFTAAGANPHGYLHAFLNVLSSTGKADSFVKEIPWLSSGNPSISSTYQLSIKIFTWMSCDRPECRSLLEEHSQSLDPVWS